MGICRWLGRKEEVSLFDNGLRIESNLKILCDDKWQSRYVVCQRRCLSEAPLLGIFKNGSTREKGDHLELFYLQNYIGYEYGFKFKSSNKTLAILVQGQTLIFSFSNVESMVFWKEWLKDVCGRSAMYFVRVHSAPKDSSIIKLNSRNARIHITRYALVIVQEVPPKQRLYLNLDDLSDVECVQNRFMFRALAYPWATPQSFVFTSDQIPELTAKLQCLLKTKQYYNQQSTQVSRLPSLKNSSLGQASSSHQQLLFSPSPLYANEGRQTPSPIFASLYANEGLRRSSDGTGSVEDGPPPLKKKSVEEGPYAIPVDLGSDHGCVDFAGDLLHHRVNNGSIRSAGSRHRLFDDFQFVEGTPAQFLNQQLVSETNPMDPNTPPPGLVKPAQSLKFLTSTEHKFGKSLSRKLKRHLTGSYLKYDGDKGSINCTREATSSGSGRRVRPKKSLTPVKGIGIVKMPKHKQQHDERHHKAVATSPPTTTTAFKVAPQETTTTPDAFDSSVSSSVRIDSAIQRGSERLKWSRKSSTSTSRRNSSMENIASAHSSRSDLNANVEQLHVNDDDPTTMEMATTRNATKLAKTDEEREFRSVSVVSTTGTNRTLVEEENVGTDENTYSGSMATTVQNLNTPVAASLNELLDPAFDIKGASSASLCLPDHISPDLLDEQHDGDDEGDDEAADVTSAKSLSICSELNSRIIQRGGRNRASGRSNKDKMKNQIRASDQIKEPSPPLLPPPLPPRKKTVQKQASMAKAFSIGANDDYVEIDGNEQLEKEDNEYVNKSVMAPTVSRPRMSKFSTSDIDYIQICPKATSALRNASSAIKRSNSLYDFLNYHHQHQQQKQRHGNGNSGTAKQQSSEAEYYANNWHLLPRALTSSSSHLTHMLSKTRENLIRDQKQQQNVGK